MKQIPVNPESLGAPSGYSNGILVQGKHDLLFVAGQIAWDSNRNLVSDDFVSQFERALENVLSVVREAGGEPTHVARLTIYVKDKHTYLSRLSEVGEAYRGKMDRHYPAMSLVEVKDLLEDGALVEIEATAALPPEEESL